MPGLVAVRGLHTLGHSCCQAWKLSGFPWRGTHLAEPINRQVMRAHEVAVAHQRRQIHLAIPIEKEIDHPTTALADKVIMIVGLRVVASDPLTQKDSANFSVLNEALKVAINGCKANARQLFAHPAVDLIGEGMSRITLESLEHRFQLTCRAFVTGSPHHIPQSRAIGCMETVVLGFHVLHVTPTQLTNPWTREPV